MGLIRCKARLRASLLDKTIHNHVCAERKIGRHRHKCLCGQVWY